MSALKRVLFSVIIAQSAFLAINAAEQRPLTYPKAPSFGPRPHVGVEQPSEALLPDTTAVWFESERVLSKVEQPIADSTSPTFSILITAQNHNGKAPAPFASYSTCSRSFYAPTDLLDAVTQQELAKRLANKKFLVTCDCPGTQDVYTKFYHLLCPSCADVNKEQVRDLFFEKDKRGCLERRNAYMRAKENKKSQSEQKS